MCGIVGVVSGFTNGFTYKEATAFENMLFVDTLRGWDSTGVFGVSTNNNVLIHKEASHGPDFICNKVFADFKTGLVKEGSFAVGHNRWATRGAVKDENAHPFWVNDNIILVQNGTYRGDHKHHKNTEVDTEAVAHVIAEEPDVEKALQKINADYALVWYDVSKKKLHIIRNTARPLFVGRTKDGTVLFASELATIAFAAQRNDLVFNKIPEMLEPNHLLTFELKSGGETEEHKVKIDSDYDYKKGPYYKESSFPHNRWSMRNHSETWGDAMGYEGAVPELTHQPTMHTAGKPEHIARQSLRSDDINIVMSQYVMENLPEYHMTLTDTDEFESRMRARIADGRQDITIELVDYVKGNKHDNCTAFIVFGKILDPILENGPQPVFHWLQYNTDEHTMYNLCTQQPFQQVRLTSVNKMYFRDDKTQTRKGILTCFVCNATPSPLNTMASSVVADAVVH